MVARESDLQVKKAIPIVLNSSNAWVGPFSDIRRMLQAEEPAPRGSELTILTDEILNAVCRNFLTSGHPVVFEGVWRDFVTYSMTNNSSRLSSGVFKASAFTYRQFPGERYKQRLAHAASFEAGNREGLARDHNSTEQHVVWRLTEWIDELHAGLLVLAASLLATAGGWIRRERCAGIGVLLAFTYLYYARDVDSLDLCCALRGPGHRPSLCHRVALRERPRSRRRRPEAGRGRERVSGLIPRAARGLLGLRRSPSRACSQSGTA